jgi:hypothetical protein
MPLRGGLPASSDISLKLKDADLHATCPKKTEISQCGMCIARILALQARLVST